MLDREKGRVGPDGIYHRHVAYGIKGASKGSLQGEKVLGHSSGRGCFSHFGFMGLRADFGNVTCRLGLLAFRAGKGRLVLDREGLLHAVTLVMLLMGSMNWKVFAVFLEPLCGEVLQGGEVQCGRYRFIRGSQKVTHLVVFLKPLGSGEVGMVRASMCDCAARLGTLNSKIPRCSDVM